MCSASFQHLFGWILFFSFQNEWKETDGQPNLMWLPALRMGKKINPLPTLKGDFSFHVCTPNFFCNGTHSNMKFLGFTPYMVTAPFFLDLDPVPILLSKIGTSSVPFPGPRTKARSVPVPFQFQNFVKKFQFGSNLPVDSSCHPIMSFEKNWFADFIVSFQGQ